MKEDVFERMHYHSGLVAQGCWSDLDEYDRDAIIRFGDLVVKECIDELRQEWYDLNNIESEVLADARAVAILVGQKNGLLKAISRVKKHFGVEE
jgi:hypothetical protein